MNIRQQFMFLIFIHLIRFCVDNARLFLKTYFFVEFKGRLYLTSFHAAISLRSILCSQEKKQTNNRIVILAVATIWDVLLDMFCSCVQDFYSPCTYCRYVGYMCSVFGFYQIIYVGCYC